MRTLAVFITTVFVASIGFGTTVNQVGTFNNWTTEWTSLGGYDANNGLGEIDFVGDANDPGLYWADNGEYVFFRFRVAVGTVISTTFHDAHFLLIDVDNYLYGSGFGTNIAGRPDFGFAWDTKSNDNTKHGLEMSVFNTGANTWNGINMADIDGASGSKGTNDINGLISGSTFRTTDGYVRTIDGQSTANFGLTTFIDFAVSWNYLTNYTPLAKGQTWNVTLASIANATDHNNLSGDIGNGADPTGSITVGWIPAAAVPEPASALMIAFGGGLIAFIRRIRHIYRCN